MVDVKHQAGVWRKLIDLLRGQKYWMAQIAEDFGLTSQMAIALQEIGVSDALTMKELAGALWCDASNATGIVDRLELRGLVERRPSEHDRRAKCVLLTTAGRRLRRRMNERMNESPPAIRALSADDREVLEKILDRALSNMHQTRAERP